MFACVMIAHAIIVPLLATSNYMCVCSNNIFFIFLRLLLDCSYLVILQLLRVIHFASSNILFPFIRNNVRRYI